MRVAALTAARLARTSACQRCAITTGSESLDEAASAPAAACVSAARSFAAVASRPTAAACAYATGPTGPGKTASAPRRKKGRLRLCAAVSANRAVVLEGGSVDSEKSKLINIDRAARAQTAPAPVAAIAPLTLKFLM